MKRTALIYACLALTCTRAIAQNVDASNTEICEQVASKMAATPQHRETRKQLFERGGIEIRIPDLAALEAWAATIEIPADLAKRVEDTGSPYGGWTLFELPGTGFHALHSVDGTMHCYSSVYFAITHDQIQLRHAPPGIEGEDGACMVSRAFGFIGETPVMLEERYIRTPDMTSWLTIAPWNGDRFAGSCRINFEYEPTFELATPQSTNTCVGVECSHLRKAAETLVRHVQRNPHDAWQASLSAMDPITRDRYLEVSPLVDSLGPRIWEDDPANLTEEAPIRLPHTDGERLYVASLGHKTIGWRYFSDWGVTFHEMVGDQLVERAKFDVEMSKGAIKKWMVTAR